MAAALDPATNTNSGTLSNGNLTYAATSASGNVVRSDTFTSTRKFYFEYTMTVVGGSGYQAVGIVQQAQGTTTPANVAAIPAGMWEWRDDGLIANNGSSSSLGTAAANGDVIMVACDPVAGKMWFGKSGTWFGSGDPAAGTNASFSGLTGAVGALINMFGTSGSPSGTMNFGATAYAHTPPTGFGNLAANAYSMTATPGSYAITGAAATVGRLVTLIADIGTYAITGADATFRRVISMVATAGSYAITGADATIKRIMYMITAVGAYATTGVDANKFLKFKVNAGSYAITGFALIGAAVTAPVDLIRKANFVLQKLRVTAPKLDQ